jgi:hypothetical protein
MIGESTHLTFDQPVVLLAAAIVAVLATARFTRLIVDDSYPPVQWLTEKFVRKVPEKWGVLVECPWCVSPYIAAIIAGWGWASGLHWSWWFVNTVAALSWLAGFMSMRDVPEDQRE